jgi:single stranded DNA-binding protein
VPVCSFGIAVNRVRSRNEEVDFFDISAWRELGETIATYKKKGDPILVEGRLQYRTWEAQDGSKRSKVDVVADNVQFLGRRVVRTQRMRVLRVGKPDEWGAVGLLHALEVQLLRMHLLRVG